MYFKYCHILKEIESHLEKKEPFSIVRLGDGDLKLLWELHKGRVNKLKFSRSGVPHDRGDELLKIYRDGCNSASYTSSFEYYLGPSMWNRKFSSGTAEKVRKWKKIYKAIGIKNNNFCSPEIGFLFFMNHVKNNLFNLMKGRKVCVVSCYKALSRRLAKANIDATVFTIPAIGKGHYDAYSSKITQLRDDVQAKKYDLYLVAAGALGKGYSFHIKGCGGISIDIGQVAKYWISGKIADRYRGILAKADPYTFKFTSNGKKFEQFL